MVLIGLKIPVNHLPIPDLQSNCKQSTQETGLNGKAATKPE
jgi:hypothetical protein